MDIAGMIKRVQRGGVHPTIKGEVWEFLLGCYDPKSTTEQCNQLRQQRRLEYEQLKAKCREMDTAVGSGRVITMPVVTEDGQPIENPNGGASASPISWASQSLASGGRQETEQYPAKPAYSIMICNSACVWDKEVSMLTVLIVCLFIMRDKRTWQGCGTFLQCIHGLIKT